MSELLSTPMDWPHAVVICVIVVCLALVGLAGFGALPWQR